MNTASINSNGELSPVAALERLKEGLKPLHQDLFDHSVYRQVESLESLHLFMEHHVFAVWDFMCLLKALQRHFTCTEVPWLPRGHGQIRRFINEIVLAEESDDVFSGRALSHFEFYREAMIQCGANTSGIDCFLDKLALGKSVPEALESDIIPVAARSFVQQTWQTVSSGSICAVAASFTFGREDPIPNMFRKIVLNLSHKFPNKLTVFQDYLERHIDLDEQEHAPIAYRMVSLLCSKDAQKWNEVEEAAQQSLKARYELWNGISRAIKVIVTKNQKIRGRP